METLVYFNFSRKIEILNELLPFNLLLLQKCLYTTTGIFVTVYSVVAYVSSFYDSICECMSYVI